MEWIAENPEATAAAIATIAGALWIIFKAIAKRTKATWDDDVVEIVEDVKAELKEGNEDENCN